MSDFLQFEPYPFNPESMLDIPSGNGLKFRCVFSRLHDRLAHAFFIVPEHEEGEPMGICTSIEGNECEAWPASPPLQSMSIEQHATGPVALLVGMAGRSHWSASFAAITAEKKLVVEIACRIGGDAVRLGSSYAFGELASLLSIVAPNQVEYLAGLDRVKIASPKLSVYDSDLIITPNMPWTIKPVQWKYEIAWE